MQAAALSRLLLVVLGRVFGGVGVFLLWESFWMPVAATAFLSIATASVIAYFVVEA